MCGKQLKLNWSREIEARLLRMTDRESEPGHWLFYGYQNEDGYGQFRVAGTLHYAHRVSYAIYKGAIPRGKEIGHASACPFENCINPECLSLVTSYQNRKEMWQRRHGKRYGGKAGALAL